MLTVIVFIAGWIFLLSAVGIILLQEYNIRKGKIVVEEGYNGPEHVSVAVHAIVRFLLKRSIHFRKFVFQYFFHVVVRCMYYFDIFTRKMYEISRNWFVKNAVKNKGTVPHFWEHLKVYKQEMDKEKEQEGGL
jgi:hypothetical protein